MRSINQLQELSETLMDAIDWATRQKAKIDKEILLKTLLSRIRGGK